MIHPLASVHPDARLADDVTVGPFTTIHADVEIGPSTVIESGVTIFDGARIGAGCHIFPGAVVSAIPQDLKFRGEQTLAIIGDHTTLRECVTVNRGTAAAGKTVVGSHCLIMAYCHVAHDCCIGDWVIASNSCQFAGEVHVDDHAVVGGGALVHQFCHIGPYVMIQGGALINKDIPPFVKAAREPIAYAGVNSVGLRRNGFTDEQIADIQDAYRFLYLSGLNFQDATERMEAELPATPARDEIIAFVRASKRGIMRGYA